MRHVHRHRLLILLSLAIIVAALGALSIPEQVISKPIQLYVSALVVATIALMDLAKAMTGHAR